VRSARPTPLAKVVVQEQETYELILALTRRELDCAFMRFAPDAVRELVSTRLLDEEMILAVPGDHPIAQGRVRPVTLDCSRRRALSFIAVLKDWGFTTG
jgi:DNA-binding transcriptional LysR family regulator